MDGNFIRFGNITLSSRIALASPSEDKRNDANTLLCLCYLIYHEAEYPDYNASKNIA